MRAAFAEVDITPPPGTAKAGWLIEIVPEGVLDPLYSRIAIIEADDSRAAFINLDTGAVDEETTAEIREAIADRCDFPGHNVMVSATDNHAGPAVYSMGDVQRDEEYVADIAGRIADAFAEALDNLQEAEIGFGWTFDFDIAHNRRIRFRDGIVRTHGTFKDRLALCFDGPIDPEVAVIAVQGVDKTPLGLLSNYACRAGHHGGEENFSSGYPGALAAEMRDRGWPVTIFLNGCTGNMHYNDPAHPEVSRSKEDVANLLADGISSVLENIDFSPLEKLDVTSRTIELPFREPTQEEIEGTRPGTQRFVDPEVYERNMADLLQFIEDMGTQPAELQVIRLDNWVVAAIPGGPFAEFGLRVKENTWPIHAMLVSYSNGHLGYIPERAAFDRGGYETTFMMGSRLAPEAADILSDEITSLIKEGSEI
ncbi:MAG: hypothetical protein R6V19_02215 [Armatimonadota bacterium]